MLSHQTKYYSGPADSGVTVVDVSMLPCAQLWEPMVAFALSLGSVLGRTKYALIGHKAYHDPVRGGLNFRLDRVLKIESLYSKADKEDEMPIFLSA